MPAGRVAGRLAHLVERVEQREGAAVVVRFDLEAQQVGAPGELEQERRFDRADLAVEVGDRGGVMTEREPAADDEVAAEVIREPGLELVGFGDGSPDRLGIVAQAASEAQPPALAGPFEGAVSSGSPPGFHGLGFRGACRFRVDLVEVVFQRVQAGRPVGSIRGQPLVDRAQRLRIDAVKPPLGVAAHPDETGLPQHPEVLRHGRLTDRKRGNEITDRPLGIAQQIEDAPTVRLGQHFERRGHLTDHACLAI
ncbi:MAG: hypothetical protein JWP07_204 [Pseudonocardiales bacterium]|nr:hypothetical protein [Pseudonocardiales bacterium]